jgi:hypothetical protein
VLKASYFRRITKSVSCATIPRDDRLAAAYRNVAAMVIGAVDIMEGMTGSFTSFGAGPDIGGGDGSEHRRHDFDSSLEGPGRGPAKSNVSKCSGDLRDTARGGPPPCAVSTK